MVHIGLSSDFHIADVVTGDTGDVASASLQSMQTPPVKVICGVRFHDLSFVQAGSIISSVTADDQFEYIVTPNVDHVVRMHKAAAEIRACYDDAKLSLMDSRILHLLATFHPQKPKAVIPGSSLVQWMFDAAVSPDDAICIIGCTEAAVADLTRRYGLTNVSHYNPPMGFDSIPGEIEKCVAFVIDHPSRFIFLAIGSPRQERVAQAIRRSGRARGFGLCIGTSINFLVGVEKRAPVWMQHSGLEWLSRLAGNPKRLWRRYLIECPKVFPLILEDYIASFGRRSSGSRLSSDSL